MLIKLQRTFILLFSLLLFTLQSFGQDKPDQALIDAGQEIFEAQCKTCHMLTDQKVIGPGLKGAVKRVPSKAWLRKWIVNSKKVIESGDEYANKIYNEYDKTEMTAFDFDDKQLDQIIAYLEFGEPVVEEAPAAVEEEAPSSAPIIISDKVPGYFTAILVVLIVMLVLVLVVMFFMVSVLTKSLRQSEDLDEKDKELIGNRFSPLGFFTSKAFIGLVALIFLLIIGKVTVDEMANIGVQQGYAPTQPIPFSHKLHAGNYEIGCEYCHSGVRKGKSATIPSANVCMNCHNQVKQGSPNIQKIYNAIENNKPIQWVRIHNLQDFVYFNHSQHVVAGQLECQQCHGEIEKMEVVQQRAPLTMGWCINCHRQTLVKTGGNKYYDKLMEAHQNATDKTEMKVEDIGGLECSKCHY